MLAKGLAYRDPKEAYLDQIDQTRTAAKLKVPRRKLWVIQDNIESPARWVGGASPDGTANFVSARRIAVKPCAYGAPLRGCGA